MPIQENYSCLNYFLKYTLSEFYIVHHEVKWMKHKSFKTFSVFRPLYGLWQRYRYSISGLFFSVLQSKSNVSYLMPVVKTF